MNKSALSARRQRGLAVVEMALVTPVLLIILLVTFEFTRAFYQQNTLTKSVRDAARLLSSNGFKGDFYDVTDDEVNEAINLAVFGNIAGTGEPVIKGPTPAKDLKPADFSVDRTPGVVSGLFPLEHVQVSVAYAFQPLWPIPRFNFLAADQSTAFTLTATSTMRALK